MNKRLQIAGILWFVAGAMFMIAWYIGQPRQVLQLATGVLFGVVGLATMLRGRRAR